MPSRRMTFVVLSRENVPFSKRLIDWNVLNGWGVMKTGQWSIGKESYGQMRPKSTGLGQMEGLILVRRRRNHFLTGPPLLLSNIEEGIIL
jgi:hypothetical protein